MFNFQKEVVLNDVAQAKVVEVQTAGLGAPKISKKVRIHDGGEYYPKYIVDGQIFKTEPVIGSVFELTLKMDQILKKTTSKHLQILVELGLDRDYRGDYGSALYYFRKPLLIDVKLPDDAANAAKEVTKAFETVIPTEYKFVNVVKYSSGNNVVIKGADSYQFVKRLLITSFECETRCDGSSEEPKIVLELSSAALDKESTVTDYTPNKVEFGTCEYLLHNLRLPTYENIRFTSSSAPEMPVKGMTYNQYSFAYCVPRPGLGGMSVAGQTNYSTTVHTIYVPSKDASTFEGYFTTAAGEGKITFQTITSATAAVEPIKEDLPTTLANADKEFLTKTEADELYQEKGV